MKKVTFILLLLVVFGCLPDKKVDNTTNNENKSLKNIVKKHTAYITVKPIFSKEIDNWTAYRNVNLFMEKFKTISPNEALNNALELQDLTKEFKEDTIPIKILDQFAFKARVNVLHNEVLRLSDMTYIAVIKAEEVNEQVDKMLLIFSSINEKINTVFTQKKFEDEIDIKDIFIGLDTTKLDTTTLKSIEKQTLKIDARKDRNRKNN